MTRDFSLYSIALSVRQPWEPEDALQQLFKLIVQRHKLALRPLISARTMSSWTSSLEEQRARSS
jgi:hypothetical protein